MVKIVLITIFLIIVASLAKALYHLVKQKDEAESQKIAKALTVRIGISVLLFITVFILVATGVIEPHGIGSKIHPKQPLSSQSTK